MLISYETWASSNLLTGPLADRTRVDDYVDKRCGTRQRRIQPIGSRHALRIKTLIVPRVQIVTNPTTNYLIWWGPPKTNIARPTTLKTKLIVIFLQSSPYTLSYLNSGHNGFVCVYCPFCFPLPSLL